MSKLLKNSLVVSLLSLGGAFLGFVSQVVIAAFFGASFERDSFFAAGVIPAYINTIFAGSLGVVFLPKLIDVRINKNASEQGLINGVLGFTFILLLFLALGLSVFAYQAVKALFPGFNESEVALTAKLLIVLGPAIVFQAYTSILACVYHAEGKFLIPALSQVLVPFVNIILVSMLYQHVGIVSLAVGTSLGYTTAFLLVQLKMPVPYQLRPALFMKNDAVAACLRESLPWLLGSFIYRANTIIERMVASKFPAGVISYLGYAGSLVVTLSAVTMNGIATTIFPRLAEAWSTRNHEKLRYLFGVSMKFTFAVCLPLILSILAFREPIIATLFERGAFTPDDTIRVAALLAIGMGAFLFICMNTIPGKLLYATGTSTLAILNGVIEVAIYIGAAFLLSNWYSYTGIAYAQVISTMCSTLFAALILQVRFQVFNSKGLTFDMLKILACGLVSYFLMISYKVWIGRADFWIMIGLGTLGMTVYLAMVTSVLTEGRTIRNLILAKMESLIRMNGR